MCPPEGEATYDGMPHDTDETLAFALGSLERFGDLLAVYAEVAESLADAEVLSEVRADNDRAMVSCRRAVGHDGSPAAATAHELYRVRELRRSAAVCPPALTARTPRRLPSFSETFPPLSRAPGGSARWRPRRAPALC